MAGHGGARGLEWATLLGASVLGLAALFMRAASGLGLDQSRYDEGIIKAGVVATVFWGLVGFLVGVIIASQLAFPNLMYFENIGWLNFGRLRPVLFCLPKTASRIFVHADASKKTCRLKGSL